MPPTNPYPKYMSQSWCQITPKYEMKNPRAKQHEATNIALRGPADSSHLPNTAAERPRSMIATEKIQASSGCVQSPGTDFVIPSARESGILKTLKAYA